MSFHLVHGMSSLTWFSKKRFNTLLTQKVAPIKPSSSRTQPTSRRWAKNANKQQWYRWEFMHQSHPFHHIPAPASQTEKLFSKAILCAIWIVSLLLCLWFPIITHRKDRKILQSKYRNPKSKPTWYHLGKS